MKCYQAMKLAAAAGAVLMLNGCSSFSWSSLSPVSWFSSSGLTVTAQGVGGVNNQTAMTETAISQDWTINTHCAVVCRPSRGRSLNF